MDLVNSHAITLWFGVCGNESGHGIYTNSLKCTELRTNTYGKKSQLPSPLCASPGVSLCGKAASLSEKKLVAFFGPISTSANGKHEVATVSGGAEVAANGIMSQRWRKERCCSAGESLRQGRKLELSE